jgi:adenosylhomocysteine nucleosidase
LTGVGVIAALAAEARALGRRDGSLLTVSGMGWAAAQAAARALVEARVSALMTFGLAGALDPALHAGSIILPSELLAPDGTRIATHRIWRERVAATLSASHTLSATVNQGCLLTSAHAIESIAEKAAAFRDTGATAVDMESAAVAEVAATHQLPFIAVRVIVDTAADALPPVVTAASRAGRVQMGRLLSGLALAPGQITALLRLALRYRTAMRSLRWVGAQLV